jgi:tRNA G10  N-methylase Trm11
MVVGMMPPKIAQIMINLASKGDRELQIYDCFCGLGTTIIEAKNAGYAELLASDISVDMVKTTLINTEKIDPACEVFHHDARKIDEINIAKETVIVTE